MRGGTVDIPRTWDFEIDPDVYYPSHKAVDCKVKVLTCYKAYLDRDDTPWNGRLGYSHFALTVDDIFAAYDELVAAGVTPDTQVSKGPSETYQFWVSDPDGNKFEVMQYTDKSYQVVGHID